MSLFSKIRPIESTHATFVERLIVVPIQELSFALHVSSSVNNSTLLILHLAGNTADSVPWALEYGSSSCTFILCMISLMGKET